MELDRLREEIFKEIKTLPRDGRAPRFNDIFIGSQAIAVDAANIWSLYSIVERTPTFRHQEGLNLESRERIVCKGSAEDPSTVLRRQYFQNPNSQS